MKTQQTLATAITPLRSHKQPPATKTPNPIILPEKQYVPFTTKLLDTQYFNQIIPYTSYQIYLNTQQHQEKLSQLQADLQVYTSINNKESIQITKDAIASIQKQIKQPHTWGKTKHLYKDLYTPQLSHIANLPLYKSKDPNTTLLQGYELYSILIQKGTYDPKEQKIRAKIWLKITQTIQLYNQAIADRASVKHYLNEDEITISQENLQHTLGKKPKAITDKVLDTIELYSNRVAYSPLPENNYYYKESYKGYVNCHATYTEEERNDDHFYLLKQKFSDSEKASSPIYFAQGKRKVSIKTQAETQYDLESILWLIKHNDAIHGEFSDLIGPQPIIPSEYGTYTLRKQFDTFKTIEEWLEKFENTEVFIDLRPAPITDKEIAQRRWEDKLMAARDSDSEPLYDSTTLSEDCYDSYNLDDAESSIYEIDTDLPVDSEDEELTVEEDYDEDQDTTI